MVRGWWSASNIIFSSSSQQPFSAAFLSSSSQQPFSAALLSSSSQQLFSAIILLWSGVGGQVCYRSLEGPFRNAFGKRPPMPPPLRNDQYPERVTVAYQRTTGALDKAHELYRITCELITLCQTHKILWSCENPGRSFMWQTTSFVSLFDTIPCESTQLHHCMYGSSRRKLTRLIHNIPSLPDV